MVRYIDDYRSRFGVEPICRVLPIAPSTYYEMKARQRDPSRLPPRAVRDEELKPEIRRVWEANYLSSDTQFHALRRHLLSRTSGQALMIVWWLVQQPIEDHRRQHLVSG